MSRLTRSLALVLSLLFLSSAADVPNPERGIYNWPADLPPRRWRAMPRRYMP